MRREILYRSKSTYTPQAYSRTQNLARMVKVQLKIWISLIQGISLDCLHRYIEFIEQDKDFQSAK